MRKMILSISLAAALASTNAVAGADMLRAVQAALPAGQALTASTALALENADKNKRNTEDLVGEEAMILASILAWYSDDVDALTAIVRAIAREADATEMGWITYQAVSYAPNYSGNFKQALTVGLEGLASMSPQDIDGAIRSAYLGAVMGKRETYERPDDPIAYIASPS